MHYRLQSIYVQNIIKNEWDKISSITWKIGRKILNRYISNNFSNNFITSIKSPLTRMSLKTLKGASKLIIALRRLL